MSSYQRIPIESSIQLGEWISTDSAAKLFALIDYTSLDDTAKQLLDSNAVNLYGDLEGTVIASEGPRLVEVSRTEAFPLLEQCLTGYPVALLLGECEVSELAAHLREIREVLIPEETRALFRYQDLNVLRALFPLLLPAQGQIVLGPLTSWGVLDPCHVFHALSSDRRKGQGGQLRFDKKQVAALEDALFIHTVEAQIRDTDNALLNDSSPCEIERRIEQYLKQATSLGLNQRSDKSLYAVLSFQFPEGFEQEQPFANALRYQETGMGSFGEALDRVSPAEWNEWDKRLQEGR